MASLMPKDDTHSLIITQADISAAADKTYDIMGTSAHNHTVKVTAAMFTMLSKGMMIMVTSSTTLNHSHMVTVKCA
jgi:hypothetical protein